LCFGRARALRQRRYRAIASPCSAWVRWSVPLSAKYRNAANSGSIQFSQEEYVGRNTSSTSWAAAQLVTLGCLCGEKLSAYADIGIGGLMPTS
jgi:hypothetical protein